MALACDSWYKRLFEVPVFVNRVKERFNYFYERKNLVMNEIIENVHYIERSVIENENRWGILYNYVRPNYNIWGCYLNEVQYFKEWINDRFEWLKTEYDKM